MFRYAVIFAISVCFVESNLFGPKYPPTKGKVWPRPKHQVFHDIYYQFNPHDFNVTVVGHTCDILTKAIARYSFFGKRFGRIALRSAIANEGKSRRSVQNDEKYKGALLSLQVDLGSPCEEYPYFGMDESYNLTVSPIVELKSASIWGILHGLETLSHLFYITGDDADVFINKTHIYDAPRYNHRGLLLDTSRHYISMFNIQRTLDAMAMNKLNVLHWHIVDDQSFPYQSEKFPDLSRLGAYHTNLVYTKDHIRDIVDYARHRGIRVLPEFDVPGHTRSWGEAYPNILTTCYKRGVPFELGPMNPIQNVTYKLLQDLFVEVQERFPDKYLHVGGDEVDLSCWNSNPELQKYMREHNMTSASKLHALFMGNVIPLLGDKSTPIVWQEVFDEGVPLPENTLIQVWTKSPIHEMTSILEAGFKLIYSTSWYLDHLKGGGDWEGFYKADPRQMLAQFYQTTWNLDNIVGGEACMWGEVVDDANVMSRVWPRASAVAEKLWSPPSPDMYEIPERVYNRLEEHTCRMKRRGIPAQPPNGPGYCVGAV